MYAMLRARSRAVAAVVLGPVAPPTSRASAAASTAMSGPLSTHSDPSIRSGGTPAGGTGGKLRLQVLWSAVGRAIDDSDSVPGINQSGSSLTLWEDISDLIQLNLRPNCVITRSMRKMEEADIVRQPWSSEAARLAHLKALSS